MFAIRIKHSGWRTSFLKKGIDPETFDPSKMSLFPLSSAGIATFATAQESNEKAIAWGAKMGRGLTGSPRPDRRGESSASGVPGSRFVWLAIRPQGAESLKNKRGSDIQTDCQRRLRKG